ncbi:putative membrane protein [Terriglobus roseus DSM 18391]|uniref:Putative membrane protein n=1 Tax=Terriglobus roseus (strain DSM 18391 / NRRL B-41598 / KBS 63) TaxID=926566 RepID=I3ZMC9_TERRK|nr:putative membrane protein [Terriglobus roseus DSM 18391]
MHVIAALLQTDATAHAAPHVAAHGGALKHISENLKHFFERFGIWGLAAIALLDSALLPMPWQVLLISNVHSNPSRFLIYPVVAAVASAIGSLVPFYVGRLGGEIFLLGKINRERYERLRDRFERQEFLAIFVPAMGPPPTPIKLFEFCAGVFEMKPLTFLVAILLGKLVQFTIYAVITHVYGPGALGAVTSALRGHTHLIFTVAGLLLAGIAIWVVRKLFDRRRGTRLPIEEEENDGKTVIVEE